MGIFKGGVDGGHLTAEGFVQRPTHGEVPAYNNAELLFSQARFWELDGTVTQATPSPSGHLGGGLF
jgi:hypothetical protein